MQEPFSEFSEELNLTGTVINEDEILDDYEPSEREINSYALQLGMDPQEDHEYLYLAREGLKAPIPKPWTACRTKDGKIFYYNFETEESQWEHPLDQNYKEKFFQVKHNRTKDSMSPISINLQTVENQHQNNTERIEFTAESPVGGDMMDSLEFSDIQSRNKNNYNNNFQQVLSFDESRQSLHFVVEKAGNKIKQQVKQQGEKKSSSGGSSKEYIGSGENILDKALVMSHSDHEEEEEENSEKVFGEYFDTEGAWQRTDGDERTPGLNTLKEIEVEALEAFQKYEDDLKSQFSYVISQFEQNYQKHAAKIEEQYQKEIEKLEQEVEEDNNTNLEDAMKTIETEAREQYEKDLKSQIKDLNKAYENMRESMEEKAEAEIQHCLEEVREKWNVEIQTISKNVVHRRAKSASIKPEVPEYQLDNRRSSWGYMDSVKANSSSNFNRLGQEVLFDFGKDCERFAREVQKSLKEEIKIIEVEKQEYRKSLVNTKSIMERHYMQKFQENKRKLEEEFAQNMSDSSCSSNNYDNSLSCSLVDNSERFAGLKARGPELLKQLNAIKQPNKQGRQERELKSELKQLEEDIFYRQEYVDFMTKIVQKTSLVTKDVQAKEKAIKVLEKEINEIEKEIAAYKKQLKTQQANLDQLKQQEVEKDHLSLKAQTISSEIEKIDNEIETLKHTPIIPAPVHHQYHQPKESQKDLSKILNDIKEIKDLAKYKSRKSVGGSAEKSRKSSSPNKHNRTIEYHPSTNYSQQIETNIDDDLIQDISVSPFLKDEHPRKSQAISYEWEEEEEKSYDREGRFRTREFPRGRLPPQLEKCPQTEYNHNFSLTISSHLTLSFEWKVFLETEQSRISIYMIALQRKKYDLRKSQDELEKDQDEYKHDYLSYKHDKNKRTYTRRLQLENRKKCLNQRIKKYNEILFWIREQENILASKKDILKNIEKTFEEAYRCQGLDEDTLGYLHRVYKGINLDDYNLITENSSSPNKSFLRTQQDESMYMTSKGSNNYASYAKIHHGMVKEKEKMLWSRGGNLKQLTLE